MEACLEDADEPEPQLLELMEHQKEALRLLKNGNILFGGVGAGKTATALAYYLLKEEPKDIYVITTAKKRDSLDWDREGAKFGIGRERSGTISGTITIDSWNNIGSYVGVQGAFFIFDEQRLVGHGAWVKNFLKIVKHNNWIMLTATPGDVWMDYAPVFIANGWYRNITDFKMQHVIYAPFLNFPKVQRYVGTARLEKLRSEILVEMPYLKHTNRILNFIPVGYDEVMFKRVLKSRWNIYEDRPIKDANELFRVLRRLVNSHPSRLEMVRKLTTCHAKLIIFYNFNYELEILRTLADDIPLAEWNGHRKQPIPNTDRWVYIVQYNSGSESWNCTETDAMIQYSLTYSYKQYIQSMGRIDRLDTLFVDLYYYIFVSSSFIDKGVREALDEKRSFNERELLKNWAFPAKNI
jgi:hypothetical protein